VKDEDLSSEACTVACEALETATLCFALSFDFVQLITKEKMFQPCAIDLIFSPNEWKICCLIYSIHYIHLILIYVVYLSMCSWNIDLFAKSPLTNSTCWSQRRSSLNPVSCTSSTFSPLPNSTLESNNSTPVRRTIFSTFYEFVVLFLVKNTFGDIVNVCVKFVALCTHARLWV